MSNSILEMPHKNKITKTRHKKSNTRCSICMLWFYNVAFLFLFYQVLESDLRKKMAHAQEVYNHAKHTLTYFSFQKQRLEDLMTQMAERLKSVEGSLSDLSDATSPEDIATVKVFINICTQKVESHQKQPQIDCSCFLLRPTQPKQIDKCIDKNLIKPPGSRN